MFLFVVIFFFFYLALLLVSDRLSFSMFPMCQKVGMTHWQYHSLPAYDSRRSSAQVPTAGNRNSIPKLKDVSSSTGNHFLSLILHLKIIHKKMEDMTVFDNSGNRSFGSVMVWTVMHLFQMYYHKSRDMKGSCVKTVLVKNVMFTLAKNESWLLGTSISH